MIRVINFHDVRDMVWFEKVVLILKKKYNIIRTKDLVDYYVNNKRLSNSCLLTVDDGDKTFYDVIYPILKKYNVPAVIFVSPEAASKHKNFWFQEARGLGLNSEAMKKENLDTMWRKIDEAKTNKKAGDKEPQNMTINQLLEIDKDGLVEIGAHTMMHPILANETDIRSKSEIVDSINGLEAILNHPIYSFAYPNGQPNIDFGEREIEVLKNTTCKIAFSTKSRNIHKTDNIYSVPRFGLSYGSTLFIYIKLFMGKYWNIVKRII